MEVRGTRMDGPIVQPGRNSGGLGQALSTREPFSGIWLAGVGDRRRLVQLIGSPPGQSISMAEAMPAQ
jgi:hypothetical protein